MFVCESCGETFPVWSRKCRMCKKEMTLEKKRLLPNVRDGQEYQMNIERLSSGFPIFDRVFNGGFMKSFLYFIYAEKGAGKTTFLLQAYFYLTSLSKKAIYFCFDESQGGILKKCEQYGLSYNPLLFFYDFKNITDLEATIFNTKPDFVVVDSLQSLGKYNAHDLSIILNKLKILAQKYNFVLSVIGEQRKDKMSYLGPGSIGHIADVLVKMEVTKNNEVVISTPEKNRDTDDKTSRCFFQRTEKGFVETPESETGMWRRHNCDNKLGLASFIIEKGDEYVDDEVTAAEIPDTRKASLKIAGMNSDRAIGILAVLQSNFIGIDSGFILRANYSSKLSTSADLACMISVLSLVFKKPVPINTLFIGGIDNQGFLLPVDGMVQRVKRAEALGYRRIIGPKTNQPVQAIWEEAATLKEVWEKINQQGG